MVNRRPISPVRIRSHPNLGKHSHPNLGKHSQRNLGKHNPHKRVVSHLSKPSPAQDNPRRVLPSPASRGNPPKANLDKRSHPNLGKHSQRNLGGIRSINLDKLSQGRASLLQAVQDRVRANPAVAKEHRARASKPAPLLTHL
jgi:hypothetical protein